MAEKSYAGGCHCGAVRYEVQVDIDGAIECNCSRCAMSGMICAFTSADKFKLISGEGGTISYKFNTHKIDHRFCKTCGIEAFAQGSNPDGTKMAAVNVRCLDGIVVADLTPKRFDGKSR